MGKRGQISTFLIAGLLALFILGGAVFYARSTNPGQITTSSSAGLDSVLNSYVQSCMDQQVKQGIIQFGLGPASASQIQYYMDNHLKPCIDLSIFERQGVKVQAGTPKANVEITDRAVIARAKYPITLIAEDRILEFEIFDYALPRVTPLGAARLNTPAGRVVAEDDVVKEWTNGGATLEIKQGTDLKGEGELKLEDRKADSGNKNEVVVGNIIYSIKGIEFDKPAELTISYMAADIPKGYNEEFLAIARYDKERDVWESVEKSTTLYITTLKSADSPQTEIPKGSVTGEITQAGDYAIVLMCKPTSQVPQIEFTDWLYREQVYSTDSTLIGRVGSDWQVIGAQPAQEQPAAATPGSSDETAGDTGPTGSVIQSPPADQPGLGPDYGQPVQPANQPTGAIAALPFGVIRERPNRHENLVWSGGSGDADKAARKQTGTPKGKPSIGDWDEDDKIMDETTCDGCEGNAGCNTLCRGKAKEEYRANVWVVEGTEQYKRMSNDGIKDGSGPSCKTECCGGDESNPCPKKCPVECNPIQLATPNNYGYNSVADAGGKGEYEYKLRPEGNSCVNVKDTLKIDLRSPPEGACDDECKGKLNGKDVNVDYTPIPDSDLKAPSNKLEVEVINTKQAASYARGYFELITGTGNYPRCAIKTELKENCLCGTTNVNILEDHEDADKEDYGEWEIKVKEEKFCCEDGIVVDDISKCQQTPCPTEATDTSLAAANQGCVCGSQYYDNNRDGPGYCCSTQTCVGQKCTPGQGLATGTAGKEDLEMHEYKLEYKNGKYSMYMDTELIGTSDSQTRPKGISIGNPLENVGAEGTWTSIKVESITVTDSAGKEVFKEGFTAAQLDPAKWDSKPRTGVIAVSGGSLELKMPSQQTYSASFPYVSTKGAVFPETGDFTLTFKMQYTYVTGYGVYLYVGDPAKTDGVMSIGQDNSWPQDSGKYYLRVWLVDDLIYKCGGTGGCGGETCSPVETPGGGGPATPANCGNPNKFGVHTMLQEYPVSEFGTQLDKAKELVGDCGMAKNLVDGVGYGVDITKWSTFIKEVNRRKMIPVIRLQGKHQGDSWQKPDPANNYAGIAAKYAETVAQLEAASGMKVNYVEIWNEPNLGGEWGGAANPEEYAAFLLAAAKAIRQEDMKDGKRDTNIISAGLAVDAPTANGNIAPNEFIERMLNAKPELKDYIDIWGSHPYPPAQTKYRDERAQIANKGLNVPALLTEISWKRHGSAPVTAQQFKDIYKAWYEDTNTAGAIIWLLKSNSWSEFNMLDSSGNGNEYYNAIKEYRQQVAPAQAGQQTGGQGGGQAGSQFQATITGPSQVRKAEGVRYTAKIAPDEGKAIWEVSLLAKNNNNANPKAWGCPDEPIGEYCRVSKFISGQEQRSTTIPLEWSGNTMSTTQPGDYTMVIEMEEADASRQNAVKCSGKQPLPAGFARCNKNFPSLKDSLPLKITA